MEQTTLKYLRVLIPGVIFLVGFFPTYKHLFPDIFQLLSIDFSYLMLLSLLVGGIYYQSNLQWLITCISLYIIRLNIMESLVRISGLTVSRGQARLLWRTDKFMHVFYKIVDNDESLKRKAAIVYFNGIFWTSTADSFIISSFFFFFYKSDAFSVPQSFQISRLFGVFAFLSYILHCLSVLKHVRLSNDQLRYIETHHATVVKDKLNEILQ